MPVKRIKTLEWAGTPTRHLNSTPRAWEHLDRALAAMVPGVHLTRAEPGNNEFQFFKVSNSDDST